MEMDAVAATRAALHARSTKEAVMDTKVRNAGSSQVTADRGRAEGHGAASAPRADRDVAVSTAVERTAGASLERTLVVDGLIGFVLMAAAVYVVGLAVGAGPAGALGMAVFCAFWGGLGFGCMFGGVMYTMREERREAGTTNEVESAAKRASVAGRSQ